MELAEMLVTSSAGLKHGGVFMYKTVQSSRLYEQIVQQIEDSISQGALKPGDQLPAERDLARQFGVSRTAVREQLRRCAKRDWLRRIQDAGLSSPTARLK